MEERKPGRPKADKPTRNQTITFRLTEEEYRKLKDVCYEHRLAYVDVLLKGLDHWSPK